MEHLPDFYPLSGLQIGDIKSHLSETYLFFATASQKLLILVDNQSWLENNHSRSVLIWGLVVNKYRMSPFRNTKALLRRQSYQSRSSCSTDGRQKSRSWFPVPYTDRWKGNTPFSFMDLSNILLGFIVFEVSWKDVRGINYYNQLQTDASLALEVKSMKKWEFHDVSHAISCINLWFSGTSSEVLALHSNLILLHSKIPSCSSRGITVTSEELIISDAYRSDVFPEDVFFDLVECPSDSNNGCTVKNREEEHISEVQSLIYRDKFLQFLFNERDLPCKLRQIITSDFRLLTLLESGLPSWVIFFQSYPLFVKVYRPWIRPLVKTLYVLISLTTLVIGFYDLYKNVPLLKKSAFHLYGPLFRWIEDWEMVTRIKYLGTMLFLQNFEKAVKWLMVIVKMLKPLVSLLKQPFLDQIQALLQFMTPLWKALAESGGHLCHSAWVIVASLCCDVTNLVQMVLLPFKFLIYSVLTIVLLVSQIFYSAWKLLLLPTRICRMLASYIISLLLHVFDSIGWSLMILTNTIGRIKTLSQSKSSTSNISFWRSLWNDLLSKVFHSLRSVIHGLATFFASCNRHRLSINNYLRAILWQLCCLLRFTHHGCPCRQAPHIKSQAKFDECDRCE